MTDKEMAARPETIATTSSTQQADVIATTTKIETILRVFVPGASLNRFEAERHHDHCLHSTVASLEGYGITIGRQWEKVPCLGGRAWVRCKRYWLERQPDNVAAAQALLAVWGRP